LNDFNVAFMIILKLPRAGVKEKQDYDRYDHDQDCKPCRSFVNRKHSGLNSCVPKYKANDLVMSHSLSCESDPLDILIL